MRFLKTLSKAVLDLNSGKSLQDRKEEKRKERRKGRDRKEQRKKNKGRGSRREKKEEENFQGKFLNLSLFVQVYLSYIKTCSAP